MRQDKTSLHWLLSEFTVSLFLIFLVAYVAYGLFYAPVLYADDWSQGIGRVLTNSAKWIDLTNRRPLLFAPFLLQYYAFGLDITTHYIVLWLINVLLVILLYKIVNCYPIFRRYSLSLSISLLFLIFPTVYVHMWLTMLHGYTGIGLALFYAYFLLRFAKWGSWIYFLFAIICLITSFGLYEAQLGLVFAWAILLFALERQLCVKRRLSLLLPVLLVGIFALWRTFGYQTTGINDEYFQYVATAPDIILSRMLLGYRINIQWGWTTLLQNLFSGLSNTLAYILLILLVVVSLLCARWFIPNLVDRNSSFNGATRPLYQRWLSSYPYALMSLLGLSLIGVGYIPIISVFSPNLSDIGSRFNIAASIGGAIFWASALMILVQLLAKHESHIKYLYYVATIPFLIIGILTHASVQHHSKVIWEEQKQIWQELLTIAPDLKDDTMVLLILPGYQDRVGYQNWRRTPIYAYWDATHAIRILYDNATLEGDVIFTDINADVEPTLTRVGVVNRDTNIVMPYEQVVAFSFDSEKKTMKQIYTLSIRLAGEAEESTQLCLDCVLDKTRDVPLRSLILD